MLTRFYVCFTCLVLLNVMMLQAQNIPDGGKLIVAPKPRMNSLGGMRFSGKELAEVKVVRKAAGQFAYRVNVPQAAPNRWDVQLNIPIKSAIRKGNVYLLTFDVRCVESMNQEGTLNANIEHNGPPWTKAMGRGIAFGTQWQKINLPFVVRDKAAFAAGDSLLTLHLGATPQIIELANIKLYDYAQRVHVEDLPKTRSTYKGSKLNAPWRKVAAKRIDQYRKANLQIIALDQNGKPTPNVKVHIQQQRHAFAFGTALNIRYFHSGKPEVATYREELLKRFNAVVFENALKWQGDGHTNEQWIANGIDFVQQNKLFMRGHVLVWPGIKRVPNNIKKMIVHLKQKPDDDTVRQQLRQAVADRITWMASNMTSKVNDWDVVNETFSNHDIMDAIDPKGTLHGNGVMVDWFKLARKADSHAKLFLNDYGILTNGPSWTTHQQYFFDTVKQLIANDAPIDGIGMQAHFGAMLTSPTRLWEVLDRYSKLGLRIKVTEFDMDLDDPQLMADYTRDFYTALFAHPQVDGLLSWGFWAGKHWRPHAAYLDKNFKPRPHDLAMRDLLFKQWWTDSKLLTNVQGSVMPRVFKGDYQIQLRWPDGHLQQQKMTVGKDSVIQIRRN